MSWHCPDCGSEDLTIHCDVRAHGPIYQDADDPYPVLTDPQTDLEIPERAGDDAFDCNKPGCGWYSPGTDDGGDRPVWVPDELARGYIADPYMNRVRHAAA